jgi:DNA-binding NarL/FixJ family response regulator
MLFLSEQPVDRNVETRLRNEMGVEVVGATVTSPAAAASLVTRHRCDVVVVRQQPSSSSAAQVVRAIREAHPMLGVVVWAAEPGEAGYHQAIVAGATGYVLDHGMTDVLLLAVRAARQGASVVPSSFLWRTSTQKPVPRPVQNPCGRTVVLTSREQQVLRLLTQGNSNKELSSHLGLAVATIKKHIQSIIAKLGVSSRTEAALLAVREKLFD